jgi:predicted nuclease of predicted toxin-antitoxin system
LRILLDENIEPGVAGVLAALRHTVVHVGDTSYRSAGDVELMELVEQFDVFVTLDLHRQLPEWLAVNQAMLEGRVRILRLRLAKTSVDPFLPVASMIVATAAAWTRHFEAGAVMVTVKENVGKSTDYTVRRFMGADIEELLRRRGYRQP